jgi:PTS system fructose-specific IIC component
MTKQKSQKSLSIFSSEHLLFDVSAANISAAFRLIAQQAKSLGIIDDVNNLVTGFKKRETVSTTGLAESFAIPHAMSANINRPAIIVARFTKGVD